MDYFIIVCEHKDRLSRVGFNYLKVLLNQTNRDIEVVNLATERTDDLMHDFVSILRVYVPGCIPFVAVPGKPKA